ncbi:MAG: hypothetical protein HGA61_04495 [Candidatus Moranbacteria bacterium]|nr:hypothetical protein [Candidatus Moranbacteria bacterium]
MVTKISWDEIEKAIENLLVQIKKADYEVDYIIGIASGGIVPLGLLAKKLGIKNILTVTARSYVGEKQEQLNVTYLPEIDLSGKRILLVDELVDSGQTLKKITQVIIEKYRPEKLKTATLAINKKNCDFRPDFFAISSEDWMVFPWEKEDFPQYF